MKHEMIVEQGSDEQELRNLFQDTPLSKFTIDIERGVVVCWDLHRFEGVLLADNGVKMKIKEGGKATYEQIKRLLGAAFTDSRGVKRIIPPWEGRKATFLCLPQE